MTEEQVTQRLSNDNCRLKDVIFDLRNKFRLLQQENKLLIGRLKLRDAYGDSGAYIGKLETLITEMQSAEFLGMVQNPEYTKRKFLDRALRQKNKWKSMYEEVCRKMNVTPKQLDHELI